MFIVTIHDFNRLPEIKEAGADAVIFGVEQISIRQSLLVSFDRIQDLVAKCHHLGLKAYVNALRFFMEDEMDLLEKFLEVCAVSHVDGIYYSDEGVYYLARQRKLQSLLIYQPETLITNHKDIAFYLGLGLQSVSLAHECSLEEILKMTETNKNVEILVSGYFSILYSRRMLVTNYLNAIYSKEKGHGHKFDLIESTREQRMPIFEDDYGTHIYSEDPIQSFDEFSTLKNHGIDRFRIDSLFFDDDWTISVLKAYRENGSVPGSNHWYYQKTIKKKEKSHE